MKLTKSIAFTLGFITCLSSFLLGLGQEDFMLPFLMFVAATLSFYLTDVRRWIRLGDWTVNALILIIVFSMIGEILYNLMNYRNEALAFSIARTLVFVEMVLLFREKEPRFCWQILLISLLQVVVASTMQQSLLFGCLLILYIFAGLYAFILVFLRKEHLYYRRHSYVDTFLDSIRAEIAARQDRGRLIRIALITLFTGPLSLVFSFSSKQKGNQSEKQSSEGASDSSGWELLRSLFAVFPKDDSLRSEHWETIQTETDPQIISFDDEAEDGKKKIPANTEISKEHSISDYDQNWNSVPRRRFSTDNNSENEKTEIRTIKPSGTGQRFLLLSERPAFSAGTMSTVGLAGGRRELFRHLARAALFSLLVAIAVFCLVPRTGKIDFWSLDFSYGNENWNRSLRSPVGTVGFSEEIRLGSLGSVIPYHRNVISLRLTKIPGRQIPEPNLLETVELPYDEMQGGLLYLRGIALENYANGIWSPRKLETDPFVYEQDNENEKGNNWQEPNPMNQVRYFFQEGVLPGKKVLPREGQKLFFEQGSDLVCLHMTVQPLDTRVFFAPWPFFQDSTDRFPRFHFVRGNMYENRRRRRPLSTTIYSTAFKHGVQLPVVPCQEPISQENLLRIPEGRLESLTALARQWDENANLPPNDLLGRALNMEQQFLYSGQFNYQLGGTKRDYSLDPLEDFVGNNQSGHCEYFAGAMVLMLRSVGISSRVIVGFKTIADHTNGEIQVRQSDAHAWVEVYLPPEVLGDRTTGPYAVWWKNGAWLRLDPTPAAEESTMIKNFSYTLSDIVQSIRNAWSEYVVDMNSYKQSEWIYGPIAEGARFLGDRLFNIAFWKEAIPDIMRYYRSLFFKGRDTVWSVKESGFLLLPFLILLVIFILSWRLIVLVLRRFGQGRKENRHRKATIDFYVSLERLLSKIKKRSQGQTPLEYVRQFDFESFPEEIVDAYYKVRFGDADLSPDELRQIQGILILLERQISQRNESTRS